MPKHPCLVYLLLHSQCYRGTWLNATQEDASVHAITQLTRVQISLLSSSAALENSEQPHARLLANATAVLQVLLSDISDSENQMKTKSMDIALKLSVLTHCRRIQQGYCPAEQEMDVLESNIIEESLGVEQDQQSSRRNIAATRVGVRKLIAEGEKATSTVWMKHYEITWWGWHFFSPAVAERAVELQDDLTRLQAHIQALNLADQHLVAVLELQYARKLALSSWGRKVLLKRNSIADANVYFPV